ncbi:MAG: hypothetical protein ABJB40_04075 [Acidobacteriota bacterium]
MSEPIWCYDVFAMRLTRTTTRFLSLFVVAFLCLNPGAVLCLAYCSHNVQVSAIHCPLKKAGADCPHSRSKTTASKDTSSFDTDSAKGCVMPVNIIAAPLESKVGIYAATVTAVNIDQIALATVGLIRSRQIPKYYYRPPPNDRRNERIRNQVFRI